MHILLANKGHASVFTNNIDGENFTMRKVFKNEEIIDKGVSNNTGRMAKIKISKKSAQTSIGENHHKEEVVSRFCSHIVEYLSQLASRNELDSLTLVCAPSLLGELRKKIPPILSPLVKEELSKNFYTEKPHELSAFLETHDL